MSWPVLPSQVVDYTAELLDLFFESLDNTVDLYYRKVVCFHTVVYL